MAKVRNFLVRAALMLALFLPVYFVMVAMATRFGVIDWRLGFITLTLLGGIAFVLVTVLLALVGLILSLIVKPRQGWRSALIALAIPIVGVGGVMGLTLSGSGAGAPIHDIVTDPSAPLEFSAHVMEARARVLGVNPVETNPHVGQNGDGSLVRDIQRAAYPDIAPIELATPAPEAFERALATARSLGWNVGYSDAATGRIEATARTFWYGFTDDIAIKVTSTEQGARINLRSISRVGGGDAGANAGRIRAFRDDINAR